MLAPGPKRLRDTLSSPRSSEFLIPVRRGSSLAAVFQPNYRRGECAYPNLETKSELDAQDVEVVTAEESAYPKGRTRICRRLACETCDLSHC